MILHSFYCRWAEQEEIIQLYLRITNGSAEVLFPLPDYRYIIESTLRRSLLWKLLLSSHLGLHILGIGDLKFILSSQIFLITNHLFKSKSLYCDNWYFKYKKKTAWREWMHQLKESRRPTRLIHLICLEFLENNYLDFLLRR